MENEYKEALLGTVRSLEAFLDDPNLEKCRTVNLIYVRNSVNEAVAVLAKLDPKLADHLERR